MASTAAIPPGITVRELRGLGWHHEDQCYGQQPAPVDPEVTGAARTAHQLLGHRLADVAACGEEPCRSLPLDAVLPTMSSR